MSIALVFFALFGAIYFLTQYLQGVLDYTPFEAGVRMLPVAGGLILGGPLSAKLADRFGTRAVVAVGLAIVAAALYMLSGANTDSGYSLVAWSLVLLGFGMGATMAPATESIMSAVPQNHAGVGSAMNDTMRLVGGTLGVAILGSLLSSSYGADMEPAVKSLPEPAADAASDSLGHASVVADQIGGDAGRVLSNAAETAFTTAMGSTLTVAAATALAGAHPRPRGAARAAPRARGEARVRDAAGAGARVSRAKPDVQDDRAGAEEAPARGRGRPRSAEADQAILDAALRMLGTHGVAGMTIEGVAADAGVGKTTIYRRWPTKTDLIRAAISDIVPRGDPPDTGSMAGDMAALAETQRQRLAGSKLAGIVPRLLAESMSDPELHQDYVDRVITPFRDLLRLFIERGIERGELRPDLEVEALVDLLHSIPVYKILMSRGDPAALEQVPWAYMPLLAPGILNSSSAAPKSARPRSSGSSRAKRARSG